MLTYNCEREKKKRHRIVSEITQNQILSEEERKLAYQEKKKSKERNADALKFFQQILKRELPEEEVSLLNPVFERWEKFGYRREATLAYHDVERIIPEHKDIIQRSVEALHEYMNT